ncbi:DUF998 domain-containing protein [Corynebacterium kalidii]
MLTYRIAGVLLFLSGLVTGFGHVVALWSWRGLYSFTDNRIGDFTVTECQVLRDNLGTRYVCNPAYLVTNTAYVAGAFIIVVAAGVMWLAAGREGHRSVRIPAVLAGGAGATAMLAGLFPYDVSPAIHDLSMLVHAILMWSFMAFLTGVGSARTAGGRGPHPLIYGGYLLITRFMLAASVVGLLALLLLGPRGLPGAYERLAFDMLTAWLMVIGVCMYSLGGAADQESRRVADMEADGTVMTGDHDGPRRDPGFTAALTQGWGRRRHPDDRDDKKENDR